MDDWRTQVGEMERSIRAALALTSDEAIRAELERLQAKPWFQNFTWLWAPVLAKRNRVMFRPFILSAFDRSALDATGKAIDPWKTDAGKALEAMLEEADKLDDIDLTKRLYSWRLTSRPDRDAFWKQDVIARFTAATTASARHVALAKVDPGSWPGVDAGTAVTLWNLDRKAARKFILSHLPWNPPRRDWQRLLDLSNQTDPDFHFELYRKLVEEETWERDVLALPTSPDISGELQRRHPATHLQSAANVFYKLLDKHGEPAIKYVKRHLSTVLPRWGWGTQKEGKGVPQLLELAMSRGWIDLWAAILRTSATKELFDAEVRKLVRAGNRSRLELVPGRGREFHGAGTSWSITHNLSDDTACELYAKYPELLRGAYRIHVTPSWNEWFTKLAREAIRAGDHDLIDYLAARTAIYTGDQKQGPATQQLVGYYESLAEPEFVTHAAVALSKMPAFAIWDLKQLTTNNALAKLLFETSTARYLGDAASVRDLLESPQIYVQLLAFRVLGLDDARAREIAAACVDLLQATLLRKLRAGSRKLAFGALRNAIAHDETTARSVLGRMRAALDLPERRYPVEELVGLIGFALHRWPALRGAREQPVVYGARA